MQMTLKHTDQGFPPKHTSKLVQDSPAVMDIRVIQKPRDHLSAHQQIPFSNSSIHQQRQLRMYSEQISNQELFADRSPCIQHT